MSDSLHIDPRDLHALIVAGNDVQLIDVREDWEAAIVRLDDSILMPLRSLESRAGELDPKRPTVIYCHHGIRSLHAALALRSRGFTDVRSLRGGIERWATEVDREVERY